MFNWKPLFAELGGAMAIADPRVTGTTWPAASTARETKRVALPRPMMIFRSLRERESCATDGPPEHRQCACPSFEAMFASQPA